MKKNNKFLDGRSNELCNFIFQQIYVFVCVFVIGLDNFIFKYKFFKQNWVVNIVLIVFIDKG